MNPRPALPRLDEFPGSLAQKVYMSLKQAILSLTFRPGEIMQKPEICAELGVSRSPVAEAVARLSAEGLVNVVPQAGTFVAKFSMNEIREGAFLREALELAAIEVVAKTIAEEQLVLLRRNLRIQQALMEDGDIAGFYQMDAKMHELILSFTNYKRLAVLADTAWVHVNRARQLNLPAPGRIEATLEEHKAIVAALEAHDPEAARAATQYHLSQLITFLEPLVHSHPELFDNS
ncbi:Transcriptional regulator [Hoeflea phototrophica DFL-43]|jgi:DNA-binding GntR family transcriptional regulator|uniref:Transcriptional regulator n=1 Tax=Hoeflea phototrophica (strain DSM 17068 / NCIMB 14078 / DFL-43) TaxID=411684 RepID=A9CXQ8_HOEPD|nr:GntR family transcriptional regulator [Hoeflea phototrophica]EDQ35706.1 Transcriptional regulator [Hoeflea phototrophica DFL-43]